MFPGANLVLGGSYTPTVLPATAANGDQLERNTTGLTFTVGAASNGGPTAAVVAPPAPAVPVTFGTEQTIAMTGANNDSKVFIKTISNSTVGALTADGSLVITFNRPVTLNDTTTANLFAAGPPTAVTYYGFNAVVTSDSSTAATKATFGYPAATNTTTAAVKPVTAALSADGLTLTLKPNFTTAPAATDFDLLITYSDSIGVIAGVSQPNVPTVSPVGQPEVKYSIFSGFGPNGQLVTSTGAAATGGVNMIGPRP